METPTFLYKPNFCVECGERIERESWHLWTSRSFCQNCEPVFRLSRIMPSALAGAVLLFGGIFLGTLGTKPQKPVAMLSAQPVAPTKQAQTPETKPLISSSQPVATNSQPSATAPIQTQAAPANISSTPNSATPEAVYLCGARTQKGTPCSRRVKIPGRCWQHPGKPAMTVK